PRAASRGAESGCGRGGGLGLRGDGGRRAAEQAGPETGAGPPRLVPRGGGRRGEGGGGGGGGPHQRRGGVAGWAQSQPESGAAATEVTEPVVVDQPSAVAAGEDLEGQVGQGAVGGKDQPVVPPEGGHQRVEHRRAQGPAGLVAGHEGT